MSHTYTRNGKQVLMDGRHMADAIGEGCAQIIVDALRTSEPAAPVRHIVTHQGDECACSCGLRWDVHDDDPHPTS